MFQSASMKRLIKRLHGMHRGLLLLTCALSAFGLIMQYSAAGGDVRMFALPQAMRLALGVVLMVVIAVTPSAGLFRMSYIVYGACVGLLVMVELVGIMGLGAQRWVGIGAFNLQPSELMKIGIILEDLKNYFDFSARAKPYTCYFVS